MLPNKCEMSKSQGFEARKFHESYRYFKRSSHFDHMPFWHFHLHGSLFKASVPRIVIGLQVLNYDKYTS